MANGRSLHSCRFNGPALKCHRQKSWREKPRIWGRELSTSIQRCPFAVEPEQPVALAIFNPQTEQGKPGGKGPKRSSSGKRLRRSAFVQSAQRQTEVSD